MQNLISTRSRVNFRSIYRRRRHVGEMVRAAVLAANGTIRWADWPPPLTGRPRHLRLEHGDAR